MNILERDNEISISGLSIDEATLIQSAVLILAEQTENQPHARILRRIGIQIDKCLK